MADTLNLPHAGARFNFGASAKGRAVDLRISRLIEAGIHNAIVNAGGDLKAIGQRPDRAWRVGIRSPRGANQTSMLASLEVADGEAVFTSGDYERYFEFEGRRYHHIIDPHTGYPASGAQSATVIDRSAEHADAAATALFIAGAVDAAKIMQSMQIKDWLLVDSQGAIHASASMKARLHGLNENGLADSQDNREP